MVTKFRIYYAILIILLSALAHKTEGQESYMIRVYFNDKGNNPGYLPTDLLSEEAISRRKKAGINVPDYLDLPVNRQYISDITTLGLRLHCKSKWMNSALFGANDITQVQSITALPFVRDIKIVKTPAKKGSRINKLHFDESEEYQAAYDLPIAMLNGSSLHNAGYKGEGILIAVLDGGFLNAEKTESLKNLHERSGIIATYDFVNNTPDVYITSTHGTAVLSILAGDLPGYLSGTAPKADYILLLTEDASSEFPCEEDYWAAGAEYADSAGADIISSSLGYYEFDDPSMNYSHEDLDGNTAFITQASEIAAAKGILVVTSAGNERDNPWIKIGFPADGQSVASIGAVDGNRIISNFSSSGPSADGRVKPDVCAMGVLVPVQTTAGYITRSSGTSFSCPVISGMSACLMQAVPGAVNMSILNTLRASSDRYNNPDNLYGYGIPDMLKAEEILKGLYLKVPDQDFVISPNPVRGTFELIFRSDPGSFSIEIYAVTGSLVFKSTGHSGRVARIDALQNHGSGIYFIKISADSGTFTGKIIRLL